MSVFILPSTQSYHPFTGGYQSPSHGGRRCAGRMMTTTNVQSPFDVLFNNMTDRNVHHHTPRHHPFFSQEVEEEDEEDELRQYFLHQQNLQQQRRQAVQIALARRQVEIERERERERRRIRQQQIQSQRQRRAALLAQIAWQEEQARLHRLAIAEEEQQHRQRQQYRKRQERAAAAASVLQQKQQWQEIASHGLATALQFAEWFGGLGGEEEEEEDTEMAEKTENPSNDSETAEKVDRVTTSQPEQISVPITNNEQDPPEEDISKDKADAAPEPIPIFTHPLPNDSIQRATLSAKDIQVTFDQPTNTIKVTGLWDVNTNENEDELVAVSSSSSSVTTNDDQEETRGRKRSRSPKRSRVSDVDEITGEEILVDQEENKDGFVNVATDKQPQGSIQIPLPNNANVSNLRAELTDEGFKLFL